MPKSGVSVGVWWELKPWGGGRKAPAPLPTAGSAASGASSGERWAGGHFIAQLKPLSYPAALPSSTVRLREAVHVFRGQLRPDAVSYQESCFPAPKRLSPLICLHVITNLLRTAAISAKPCYCSCLSLLEQSYRFTTNGYQFVHSLFSRGNCNCL